MELYKINTELPIEGACESGIGGRSENQDSYGYQDTPFGLLVTVCDGMGGGPAGKTASSIAVNEIISGVMEAEEGTAPMVVVEEAVRRANSAILKAVEEKPQLQGMGTTCTVVLINKVSAIVAHVGDSRVYQLRGHRKVFRTFDHSAVFEMVKQKVITEEQARLSDQSNIITRALGQNEELEIDIVERPYKKGDRFMLCSDGIHGTMPEAELLKRVTRREPLDQIVDDLARYVDDLGQKKGGDHDNLTLAIMETKTHSGLKENRVFNKTSIVLGIIAAMLAVAALLLNGCKNKDIDIETFRIAEEQVRPGIDTVGITGTYDFFREAESMKINIGHDSTLSDAHSQSVALEGKDYSVTVRNLQPDTTYYYAYSVNLGLANDFVTPTKRFTTLPRPEYTVSVSANPEDGGSVVGAGTYPQGQPCTVTATAREGFDFVNWTENGNVVSTDTSYRFTVTGNRVLVAQFEAVAPEEFTVVVSANPPSGGSVSGGGIYQEGQSCTVRATANNGHTFVNWTENGNQVSSSANYTFTVNSNRTLVANFTSASYIISATVTPEESGTVSGAGGYENGQSCTLRATANTGYTFEKWTENGTQVSTNATYTFTVTGSRNFVAHFKANTYTISTTANPPAGGIAIGGGTFEYGQSCTVTATANSGYTFTNWTENGNVVSTRASYTFTVTGNRTLIANFTANPQNYTITVSADPTNGGSVSGGGTYQQGQNCTVTATASGGYTFSNWTENGNVISSNTSYSFIVTGNRALVAHFVDNPQSYTITVTANPANGGTVSGGGTYQQGQSCTVIAEPNRASSFSESWDYGLNGWTNIDADGDGHVWYHSSESGNHNYGSIPSHSGEGHLMGESWCNALGQPLGPDDYIVSSQRYDIGTSSTLSFWACAQDVYYPAEHFGVAISMGSNTNPSDFTTIQEWTLTAKSIGNKTIGRDGRFTREGTWYQYSCNLSAYSGQQVWIAIRHFNCYDMAVMCLDDIELSSSSGFSFLNWTENGNVVSTNASYTFTVTSDRNLVANFTQQSSQNYYIGVSSNPSNGGSVSGGGVYQQGQSCTVSASANSGYTFTNWTENGNVVSTNASYNFTVNGNRNLVANFTLQAPQNYTITLSANPDNGGTLAGGGTYQEGQQCTVSASANNGFEFSNWTENGNVVSWNTSYTFTVTSNRNLVANFTAQPQNFTITVSANPSNGGTVTGGGTYQQGQTCTVTATANSGFTFTNWTENGSQVSTNASYSFTVNGDRSLVANFSHNGGGNAPTGAINGLFSVSATQQVWFSRGNLQYIGSASTPYWKFAEYQWEYLGDNGQGTTSQNVNRDLFGWGTSGYNHGAICYQPWNMSTTTSDYYVYGDWQYNLYDQTGQADWGYNAISNGGNSTGQWRTLTGGSGGEWDYLLNIRNTASGIRYARAQITGVNGGYVNGVIILPDNWNVSYYTLNDTNLNYSSFSSNVISSSVWQNSLEAHGAVFLPAAGSRTGTSLNAVGSRGLYYSSTGANSSYLSNYAGGIYFYDSFFETTNGYYRSYGYSVRLVQDY